MTAGIDELEQTASDVFGWTELTDHQRAAMTAVRAGRDVLVVMATGSGKSAIYQVPGMHVEGLVIVVSPLIALQYDQIAALDAVGAKAVAINSAQGRRDSEAAWDEIRSGAVRFVYLAPEQLANDEVITELGAVGVGLFVVDEAHCVSAWGHDFRPDYLRLADARRRLGNPAVLALTATASPPVRDEVIAQLRMRDVEVIAGDFDRPEISLAVDYFVSDDERRRAVVEFVAGLDGPGLVYAATRKDTEYYAETLSESGVRTANYHAGMRKPEREEVHREFLDDEVDVVVATSAFGMGIDKPNVRFVVHAAAPDSLDTYYQQIGRGGRDGDDTTAKLFYRPEDLSLAKLFTTARPDKKLLRRVYMALDTGRPMKLKKLREQFDVQGRALTNAVNLLERADVITSGRGGFVSSGAGVGDVVKRALELADRGEEVDGTRVEMLREYAEARRCRRRTLLSYFGESVDDACGNCDRCSEGADAGPTASGPFATEDRVEHAEWGEGTVIDTDTDRLTVRFDEHGYRTLSTDAVIREDLLVAK